jgi:CRP/FNR family cyclic AMP-dependent transcriptional regulator
VRRFDRNSAIVAEADTGNDIVIIWSGLAKVCSLSMCRPVLLALRGPGDIIGEMASISGQGRAATVIAIRWVDGLVIEAAPFHRVLGQLPHASAVLQRVLVARLRESDLSRVGAGTTNVAQRLARLLLEFERRYCVPMNGGESKIRWRCPKGPGRVRWRLPAGSSPEVECWRDRDIVKTGRRWVAIHQPLALRQTAGTSTPP